MRDFVIPKLQQSGYLRDIIFMQDGPPSRTDLCLNQLLRYHFTEAQVISYHFSTARPSRSPDKTSCDFWFRFLKRQYLSSKESVLDMKGRTNKEK